MQLWSPDCTGQNKMLSGGLKVPGWEISCNSFKVQILCRSVQGQTYLEGFWSLFMGCPWWFTPSDHAGPLALSPVPSTIEHYRALASISVPSLTVPRSSVPPDTSGSFAASRLPRNLTNRDYKPRLKMKNARLRDADNMFKDT